MKKKNLLYIGTFLDKYLIRDLFKYYNIIFLEWPEFLDYKKLDIEINSKISTIVFSDIDCIFADYINAAPLLYKIRDLGCNAPIIIISRINPYPSREFLFTLLLSEIFTDNDILLTGSGESGRIYSMFGLTTKVIPTYGINTKIFYNRGKIEARKKLGLPINAKIMIYTGRFSADKNIGGLIAIYKRLKNMNNNVYLVIASKFFDHRYFELLKDKIKELDIICLGLETEDIPYLYSASDLFVSCATSYFENLGKSPLEAIACNIPTIVPDWIGFKDVEKCGGMLIPVLFTNEPLYDPFSYAMVNLNILLEECLKIINSTTEYNLSLIEELKYENVIIKIKELIDNTIAMNEQKSKKINLNNEITLIKSEIINEFKEDLFSLSIKDDLYVGLDRLKKLYKMFYMSI